MDEIVARSIARWPDVPAVTGWLRLDRRGNWLLKVASTGAFERIGNAAFNAFIARNYDRDARGAWFFQNGPQRVFVGLDYTPLVARLDAGHYADQCGREFAAAGVFLDDEGSVLVAGGQGVALLDDRDLGAFEAQAGSALESLPRIARAAVPARFGFIPDPSVA
jgi:hypothetical protein